MRNPEHRHRFLSFLSGSASIGPLGGAIDRYTLTSECVNVICAFFCTSLCALPMEYKEAKVLADRHEKSLSNTQIQALISSQGMVGGKAMTECVAMVPSSTQTSFALVMQLDDSGRVVHTWLDRDSDVAKCFEKKMATQKLFVPPFSPFYTVYEMTFR